MEVMCEQLQNILYNFHQQQIAEMGTAEKTDVESYTNLVGGANLEIIKGGYGICKTIKSSHPSEHVLPSLYVVLGAENSKVVESQLADFLVFLRRVLSLRVMKRLSTFIRWIDPLMAIISHKCSLGKAYLKKQTKKSVLTLLRLHFAFKINITKLCSSGSPRFQNLRTKLLTFHVLERLLPACSEPVHIEQV